ncbi:MAG TPA: basic amino acid ABC transporter substrate-binding protein [Clostridia bacterium]|nr:basic amino acid ABC transporter substrate-binding protein [Clostridia bacterium]
MKKWSKRVLALLLVMGLILALAGCGGAAQEGQQQETKGGEGQSESTTGGADQKGKVYVVGTEPTFPPFEYTDEKTNEITGFDIELIKAIAEEAGIKVTVQSLGFDGLIPALQAGSIDIVIAGMSVNPERAESVDFGPAYFEAGLKIAVVSDSNEINSVDDLKGKTVAVQIGTTGALKAQELKDAGIVKEIKTYNTVDVVFLELINGTVDAVINDLPVNEAYMAKNPGKVKMVGDVLEGEEYAFAVAKGNTELLEKLTDGLAKVKDSGEFEELTIKYFGS